MIHYTPDSRLYTPHSTLHSLHSTHHSPQCRLYTLHFILHTFHSTLCTPHSTLYTPHFALHTPHSTSCTPRSALYTLDSAPCNLHSTLHTVHSRLRTTKCCACRAKWESHNVPRHAICAAVTIALLAAWQCDLQKHIARHVWSAAPATQNEDGHIPSAGTATKNASHFLETRRKSIVPVTQNDFKSTLFQTREYQEAPRLSRKTTLNNIKHSFETFEDERFCSFPHGHGDATWKSENRDDTCWSFKTSISCEASSNFQSL